MLLNKDVDKLMRSATLACYTSNCSDFDDIDNNRELTLCELGVASNLLYNGPIQQAKEVLDDFYAFISDPNSNMEDLIYTAYMLLTAYVSLEYHYGELFLHNLYGLKELVYAPDSIYHNLA